MKFMQHLWIHVKIRNYNQKSIFVLSAWIEVTFTGFCWICRTFICYYTIFRSSKNIGKFKNSYLLVSRSIFQTSYVQCYTYYLYIILYILVMNNDREFSHYHGYSNNHVKHSFRRTTEHNHSCNYLNFLFFHYE